MTWVNCKWHETKDVEYFDNRMNYECPLLKTAANCLNSNDSHNVKLIKKVFIQKLIGIERQNKENLTSVTSGLNSLRGLKITCFQFLSSFSALHQNTDGNSQMWSKLLINEIMK